MDNPSRKSTSLPVQQMTVADGNWDTVRDYPIRMIVIHTIVGSINSANIVFNLLRSQRSTHYGVGMDGKIHQWVDEQNVAYQSGDYPINQYSIGIEHEDNGNYNAPRTDALYESSSKLVADIAAFYHIKLDRDHIKKHSEVDDTPTSCPDSLDIDRIIAGAVALSATPNPPPSTETMVVEVKDWKGLLNEAGNTEPVAKLLGFTADQLKNDLNAGKNMVEQVQKLQSDLKTANESIDKLLAVKNPDGSNSSPTPPASNALPAQPAILGQAKPLTDPVKKNLLLQLINLIFG